MNRGIKDKVVVVTGASSGLGESTARHLASNGAAVVLGARRQDRFDAIVAEIRAADGRAESLTTDVTRPADVKALVDKAIDSFGRVDVIINNAGVMSIAPMSELKVEEWDQMIDVNVKGVLYGVAAALPVFEKQGSGGVGA